MKKIAFMGECMVELRTLEPSVYRQSFAGDVYNSAVYLKRAFPAIDTSVVTAVGNDKLSDSMVSTFAEEALNTRLVFRSSSKSPGLYLIETDDSGERSFTYWRSDSAARSIMQSLDDAAMNDLTQCDMFFFSGISLAVVEPSARTAFWAMLARLRDAGVTIVFDPNFRPSLWACKQTAREHFEKALTYTDIALPGVEDLTALYDVHSAGEVISLYADFNLQEVVIKNGPRSVVTHTDNTTRCHQISPVSHVVDTTSAGDAFNGVYLGARLTNHPIGEAVRLAAKAAGIVIQHKGAIAPKAEFNQAMASP